MGHAFRLASYVCVHPLPSGEALLMHPLAGLRHRIDAVTLAVAEWVRLNGPCSFDAAVEGLVGPPDEVERAWEQLIHLGYLVEDDSDDVARWLPRATSTRAADAAFQFRHSPIVGDDRIVGSTERRPGYEHVDAEPLRVVMLGACHVRYVGPLLGSLAPTYGFNLSTAVGYPNNTELIEEHDAHMVVVNPHIELVLFSLFDRFSQRTLAERRERLESYKGFVQATIENVRAASAGRLLAVHGFSSASLSAFGRAGFRDELNVRDVAHELDRFVRELIRDDADAAFIDDEVMSAREGKRIVQDDWIREFRHHGTSEDVLEELALGEPSQAYAAATASEYLQWYSLWRRRGRIKLVIVDLDNTLWPGVVGESVFEPPFPPTWWRDNIDHVANARSLQPDVLMGLHEALGMIRGRGVMLATCSKNSEDDAMAYWQTLATHYRACLRPDDFVIHRINWRRKPDNIREILDATGVAQEAAAFIDDSPHEREEVRQAFPRMLVMADPPYRLRRRLLDDQIFQSPVITVDAQQRSDRFSHKLARDRAAEELSGSEPSDFIRSLDVELTIERLDPSASLARPAELLARTNQFNTTLIRRNAGELAAMLDRGAQLFTLRVRDRFGEHGCVGVAVVEHAAVVNFAMSCRVIGLGAAAPFLTAVVDALGTATLPLRADVVDGPRNQPCRGLFAEVGFSDVGEGSYRLDDLAAMKPVDETQYRVILKTT